MVPLQEGDTSLIGRGAGVEQDGGGDSKAGEEMSGGGEGMIAGIGEGEKFSGSCEGDVVEGVETGTGIVGESEPMERL